VHSLLMYLVVVNAAIVCGKARLVSCKKHHNSITGSGHLHRLFAIGQLAGDDLELGSFTGRRLHCHVGPLALRHEWVAEGPARAADCRVFNAELLLEEAGLDGRDAVLRNTASTWEKLSDICSRKLTSSSDLRALYEAIESWEWAVGSGQIGEGGVHSSSNGKGVATWGVRGNLKRSTRQQERDFDSGGNSSFPQAFEGLLSAEYSDDFVVQSSSFCLQAEFSRTSTGKPKHSLDDWPICRAGTRPQRGSQCRRGSEQCYIRNRENSVEFELQGF
jgi:hypothetical protein